MKLEDAVPLQAIANAELLTVPFVLSRKTAARLHGMGLIHLELAGESKNGRSKHYIAYLTEKGQTALQRHTANA